MNQMIAREHHRFEAGGTPFVYLVPSAAIFALDAPADAILRLLVSEPLTRDAMHEQLSDRFASAALDDAIADVVVAGEILEQIAERQ